MTKDYSKGKIYSIRSRSRPDLVYVGSTIQPLSVRFGGHRLPTNECKSKQITELGDAYIELIENYACSSIEELRRREGQFQRSMDCVNLRVECRTPTEWYQDNREHTINKSRRYYDENKDHVLERTHEYHAAHREQILEKHQIYRDEHKEQYQQYCQLNKDKISAQRTNYYKSKKEMKTCICGKSYNYGMPRDRNRHYHSRKHQNHVQLIHERLRGLQSSS